MKSAFIIKLLCTGCLLNDSVYGQEKEIFETFICETYKDFKVNESLMAFYYVSLGDYVAQEDIQVLGEIEENKKLAIGEGTLTKLVEENILTKEEEEAMIKQFRNFTDGHRFKKLDCVAYMQPKYANDGKLLFSEPVFSPDKNKILFGVKISTNSPMPANMPSSFIEIVIMEKKADKWERIHRIDFD